MDLSIATETLCRTTDSRIRKTNGSNQQNQGSRSSAQNGVSPAKNGLCDSASKDSLSSLDSSADEDSWRHLLLVVPLRLGLSEMNLMYADSVKVQFCCVDVDLVLADVSQ
jgi:hypothetical protein